MLIEAGGVQMPGNPVKISGCEDPAVRIGAHGTRLHLGARYGELANKLSDRSGMRIR
jgi:CoA:oxalate CoA-transferase